MRHQPPTTASVLQPLLRKGTEGTLSALFTAVAARHPHLPAVEDGDRALTYQELDAASEGVAAALFRLPELVAEPARPVAVFLDQGATFITALLGVLKAGTFVVPLDPRNPEARNRFLLQDSQAPVVVTDESHAEEAWAVAAGLTLIKLEELAAPRMLDARRRVARPDDMATLLYTSGSTGQPKGVLQTHRNHVHNVMRHAPFGLGPRDRLSLFYPCGVYGGIRDILNALLSGSSLHRYPLEVEGLAPLSGWLQEKRITVYCSVATVFRQLMRTLSDERFPDVRLIKLGGEVVYRTDLDAAWRHFDEHTLVSCGLAATEIGAVRQFFVDRHTAVRTRRVPCGFPVPDMEILILDDECRPVHPGQEGEIAVRSAYLSPGYWNRPELTARAFLPDPVGGSRRIYRTGDRGRIDGEGQLVHMGRVDAQVKVRGNRIELPEVEAALLEYPGIAEVAAVLRQDPERGNRLDAFVVGSRERLDPAAIRRFLASRLPAFMVPSRIGVEKRLPLLPNGKVDRQALASREPSVAPAVTAPEAGAPGGGRTEDRLLALWKDIIETNQLDVDDEFFAAGGDSLGLLQLMVRIEQELGVSLPVSTILEAPTVRAMAAAVETARVEASRQAPSAWSGSQAAPSTPTGEPELSVAPLRTTGNRPPLFMAAPAGGTVLPYYRLAHLLGPEQPFYGLQVLPPPVRSGIVIDIPSIARHFVTEIRRLQPEGPYRLGGWSFGGFVAWEMARQLREQQQEVDRLLLIDSDASLTRARPSLWGLIKGTAGLFLILYYSRPFVRDTLHIKIASSLRDDGAAPPGLLSRLAWRAGIRRAGVSDAITADPRLLELQHSPPVFFLRMRKYIGAIHRYHPEVLAQPMDLLLPEAAAGTRLARSDEEAVVSVWNELTEGRARLHRVPGNHFTLFDSPCVEGLAETILGCLGPGAATPEDEAAEDPPALVPPPAPAAPL